MISRSFDPELLKKAFSRCPAYVTEGFDVQAWLNNPRNVMLTDEEDVGLATFEYPGVYTVHWFYERRGRKAIDLAREMIGVMFNEYGANAIRGLTAMELKAARWLAKQVGCKSYGVLKFSDGPHELLLMTKQDFLEAENN